MKRLFQLAIFLFLSTIGHLHAQNISTGITDGGATITPGASSVDPNWRVIAGVTTPTTNAKITPYYSGWWEPTPVTGTNAAWINMTGASCNTFAGNYTYERSFTITNSITSFTASLRVAHDNDLISLVLINPAGTSIPLSGTVPSELHFGPLITNTQSSPMPGTWRIRAVINILSDNPPGQNCGGFMLEGKITTECNPPCICDDLVADFVVNEETKCKSTFIATTQFPCCMKNPRYAWVVNNVFQGISSSNTFTYTFPGNGTYTVCLLVVGTMPNGMDCLKSICKTIVVEGCCNCDNLKPSFETQIDKCSGTFTSTTEIPSCMKELGAETYDWTVNGVSVGSSSALNYTFPSNGTYTVCLKITTPLPDGGECVKEKCQTVVITDCIPCNCENVKLNGDYNVDKCSAIFNAGSTLPPCLEGAPVSYDWTINGTNVGSGSTLIYTFPGNGVYTVCLTAEIVFPDGTKCLKDTCNQIVINNCGECRCNQVIPDYTYTVDNCTAAFVNTTTGPDCVQRTYKWYVNNVLVGSGNTFNYTFPGSGTYTVCMKVVGVMPGGVPCKPSICKQITVDCGPCNCNDLDASFTWTMSTCNATFNSTHKPPTCIQNVTYEWTVDGNPAGNTATMNYAFTTFGPHTVCYKVSGTMSDGYICTREACNTVYPNELCPDPCYCGNMVLFPTINTTGCSSTFDASASTYPACLENLMIKWYVGTTGSGIVSPVGTGTIFNYTFSGSGNYTVCLMISGNLPDGTYCEKMECRDITVNCINFIQQPEEENGIESSEKTFILYPNPASDDLTIQMDMEEATEVQIRMRSSDGKEILNEKRKAEKGLQRFDLKIPTSVVNSMVFIEVIANGKKITRMVNIFKQ
jgi:hypothetical protein